MGRHVWLLLLAGCNQIFSLDGTHAFDAALISPPIDGLPDMDGDGAPDEFDNCKQIPNTNQHDEDLDTVGDLCDNCPLIPNGTQEDNGDGDGVGDACDPNPVGQRDCLILFDSFADPTAFASRWSVMGSVTASADIVTLSGTGGFVSKDFVDRTFDVQVIGNATVSAPGFITASSATVAFKDGQACGLLQMNELGGVEQVDTTAAPPASDKIVLSNQPVGAAMTLRLSKEPASLTNPSISCRIDYGFAIGTGRIFGGPMSVLEATGAPGVLMSNTSATIRAIALYDVVSTCTPVRR